MTNRWLFVLPTLALLACSADPPADRADTTQRQRDSTIAESRLPYAPAVSRALDAADAAAARAAAADSIR
jgi:hypothetical protein